METPQPSPSRMTPFSGHPIVVAVVPHQPELVTLTAASWAVAAGGVPVYFAYVDPTRYTVEEHADGTVRHADIDPDAWGDSTYVATPTELFTFTPGGIHADRMLRALDRAHRDVHGTARNWTTVTTLLGML